MHTACIPNLVSPQWLYQSDIWRSAGRSYMVICRMLANKTTQQMKQYIVDAFTDKLFSGNPAGVCILDKWLPDELMQNIASENNLAETAFAIPTTEGFHIRWFTPAVEVDLCGHATLATAHVLFR